MALLDVRRLMTAVAVGGALLLSSGCGGADGEAGQADAAAPDDPLAAGPQNEAEEDGPAAELTRAVNAAMAGTSFHAVGDSTAFADSRQEMWSDPEVGVRIEVTAPALPQRGEMYCQDGAVYTSVPLFVAQLQEAGEAVEVPPGTAGQFISAHAGSDCRVLYELFPGARLDPDQDDEVDGVPTTALVTEARGTTDVYQVAAEGDPYLLRLDSESDGGTSTTRYGSFGEPVDIAMPAEESVMSMDEFRGLVGNPG